MKVGLIARAEDRGLGNLTREWYRNMEPDRVMVVRPIAADDAKLALHLDWYGDDVWMVKWHPQTKPLDEGIVRPWLRGLDVVYSAETFYDGRFLEWARDAGVRTVCHVMPEYFSTDHPHQRADVLWNPTKWRHDLLPDGARVVPVPVPVDRFRPPFIEPLDRPLRWLHPMGAQAARDRNGTTEFLQALGHLELEHHVVVRSQTGFGYPPVPANVTFEPIDRDHANYWQAFADVDGVVLPRKYGGLCMPALEAMGAGCALMMTAVEPQSLEWPIIPIDTQRELGRLGVLSVYGNAVPLYVANPVDIARLMDWCAEHPDEFRAFRLRSLGYARMHSWETLKPTIVAELERACG